MKAPGADYSPIQQAISARSRAMSAVYQAKDAANWKNRYDIQQESLDLAKTSNVVNTAVGLANAGLNFADSMVRLKTSNDQSDLALTETDVTSQIYTLLDNNRDSISYARDPESGLMKPQYSEALQTEIDNIISKGFEGKKYIGSVQDKVETVMNGIRTNTEAHATQLSINKQLQDRQELQNALYGTAVEADVASGNDPVMYEYDGETYEVGEATLKTIKSFGLSDDSFKTHLIQAQKDYRLGKVDTEWRRTLSEFGDYQKAADVINNARVNGTITQQDADSMIASLGSTFQNMEYDPQQSKLNYAYSYYTSGEHAGDFGALLDELDAKYPENHIENIELASKVLSYGASEVASQVSVAQQNIAKAVEMGDQDALTKAISSVPGSKVALQNYADNLVELNRQSGLLAKERELEDFAGSHTMGETYAKLESMGLPESEYTALKSTLMSWEKATKTKSMEQQQADALQIVNDRETLDGLRSMALEGGEEEQKAYFDYLDGLDPEVYGSEADVKANAIAAKSQFHYDKAERSADSTLRTLGYDEAKKGIESNSDLNADQKKDLTENLKAQEKSFITEIQAAAGRQVTPITRSLASGQIATPDMTTEITAAYGVASSQAEGYPVEYRGYYLDTVESSLATAYSNGITVAVNKAQNATDEAGNSVSFDAYSMLHGDLVDQGADMPDFLVPYVNQAKESVAKTIETMKSTYGSEATQKHITNIKAIGQAVKDGKIGARDAISMIYSEYGVVASGGDYTFGSGDNAETYSSRTMTGENLEQINKVVLATIKDITPDFQNNPILKNQLDLIANSLYGSNVKDLEPDELAVYYKAQEQFFSAVFDSCAKWEAGEETNHTSYNIDQFTEDLNAASSKFNGKWLALYTRDPDTTSMFSTAYGNALKNVSDAFENGYVTFNAGSQPDEKGFYKRSDLVFSNYTKETLMESEARIYDELNKKGYGFVAASDPTYMVRDGKTEMVFMLKDGNGYLAVDPETKAVRPLDADGKPGKVVMDYLSKPGSDMSLVNAYRQGDISLNEIQEAYENGFMNKSERAAVEAILTAANGAIPDAMRERSTYWDRYTEYMNRRDRRGN